MDNGGGGGGKLRTDPGFFLKGQTKFFIRRLIAKPRIDGAKRTWIEDAYRPRIEGEARVEGAKSLRIESETRTEGEAREKTGEWSGEDARRASPQII